MTEKKRRTFAENQALIAKAKQNQIDNVIDEKKNKPVDFNQIKTPLDLQIEQPRQIVQEELFQEIKKGCQQKHHQYQIINIPLKLIRASTYGMRTIVNEQEYQILKKSISKNGLLQPITVNKISEPSLNFQYELIAGSLRYRAFMELGKQKIPAIVKQVADPIIAILSLAENLGRVKLHAIEETHLILNLLIELLNSNQADIISILRRLYNESTNQQRTVLGNTPEGKFIHYLFEQLPISLGTFVLHRLRLLEVEDKILQAILDNKIGASLGVAIDAAFPKTEVALKHQLLADAIAHNWSRTELRTEIVKQQATYTKRSDILIKQSLLQATKTITSSKFWDENNNKYIQDLESLLKQIENLIHRYEKQENTDD